MVPPLPQVVIAAFIAGVSSSWVSPRLAGVQEALFWRRAFGVEGIVDEGAAKTPRLPAKNRKREDDFMVEITKLGYCSPDLKLALYSLLYPSPSSTL